jgi:MYXO-CTERM domain-containing protein
MCIIPVGVEFYQCTTPDGFYIIPFDAGVPHVRGSAIGDCAVSFGATPPPWSFAALLILVGLAARLRLRRTRR